MNIEPGGHYKGQAKEKFAMPIEFSKNNASNYYLSEWIGKITDTELLPAYSAYAESEIWESGMRQLIDLSKADLSEVTSAGLALLAQWEKSLHSREGTKAVKTAFIAPENFNFGMARIYQAKASFSPEEVRIFRDKEKAVRWLTEDS